MTKKPISIRAPLEAKAWEGVKLERQSFSHKQWTSGLRPDSFQATNGWDRPLVAEIVRVNGLWRRFD